MDASEQGRFGLYISLDAESYAFIERFMAAGVFNSRDEMIVAALEALSRAIEASARRAVMEHGCTNAHVASLEELADMLDEFDSPREH